MVAKPRRIDLAWLLGSSSLSLAVMPDPKHVKMTNMPDLINNKQRGQLCTLVIKRKKRKKECNQLITNNNPTIICLHTPHHVQEDMTAHPVKQRMTRFGHQETSYSPP